MFSAVVTAMGTRTFGLYFRAFSDDRLGQIVEIVDSFAGIGQIVTGTGHGKILLETSGQGDNLPCLRKSVKRNFAIFMLQCQILHEIAVDSPIRQFGMRWYIFHVPSVEVPETFRIAFQFNSEQYGGVYVGTRICDENESGRSFEQDIGSGELSPLQHGKHDADWMIRAYLSEAPRTEN